MPVRYCDALAAISGMREEKQRLTPRPGRNLGILHDLLGQEESSLLQHALVSIKAHIIY